MSDSDTDARSRFIRIGDRIWVYITYINPRNTIPNRTLDDFARMVPITFFMNLVMMRDIHWRYIIVGVVNRTFHRHHSTFHHHVPSQSITWVSPEPLTEYSVISKQCPHIQRATQTSFRYLTELVGHYEVVHVAAYAFCIWCFALD